MLVEEQNGTGFWSSYYIGLDSSSTNPDFSIGSSKYTLLLSNVEKFYTNYCNRYAVTNVKGTRTFYYWGKEDFGLVGESQETPTPVTSSNLPFDLSKLSKIAGGWRISYFLDTDGNIYSEGINRETYGINGLGVESRQTLQQIPRSKFNDENVIDVVSCGQRLQGTIALTDEGNLYGWGKKDYIGLGNKSEYQTYIQTPVLLDTPFLNGRRTITSITGGNNFFVVTCSDGTVWGTGNNSSGILGRWIGVERGDSNSRYRSAFTWVECPELEN